MAELIVSAFLSVFFERLASQQFVDFFRKKKLDDNLFGKLKTSLITVSKVLDDAETKKDTHPSVKLWLEELKDTTYHAEDLLDEIVTLASKPSKPKKSLFNTIKKFKPKKSLFNSRSKKFEIVTLPSKPKKSLFHTIKKFNLKKSLFITIKKFKLKKSLFERVVDIIEKMELLASQKERLGLHERVGDHNSIRGGRTTTSLGDPFVYGRDDDKQQMVESLLMDVAVGDPIPVITIVGMGGIRKTTLAQKLYNDERLDGYFDIKVWVCVTQEPNVFHITKTVLETITPSHSSNITDLNLLQLELKGMLTRKKILLVLDDVWSLDYEKWCTVHDFFTTNAASRSKIIVTTRDKNVASIMRTVPFDHSLVPLSDDDSWLLFKTHAFGKGRNGDDYPRLQEIGKQIVEKCKGLPLAIKLLGGVLRNKDDVKVWENAMKSEFWDSPTSILPALRLSYHFLPTHLKPCFAYCSIFPQVYEFEKEKLVLLWMAEGFVIDKTDKSMEELGEEYFDELVSRSFFQKSSSFYQTRFVMHDLNHDLARDVSGKFCLTLERSKTCQFQEKVRHFSYTQGTDDDNSKFEPILNAKYLRTFLPVIIPNRFNFCLPIAIIRDLLLELSCIKVLSLSYYWSIDELPDSICTLIHLRYFDLSNTSVQSLPNKICQLYNLQTLLLSNCHRLIKLPTNFGELVNLRHLDIRETLIDKLPPQIRKLKSLQTLSSFLVGEGDCSGIGELNGLRQLKGSLSISGLHNVYNVDDAIEANLKEKMGIEQLSLDWSQWSQRIEVSNNHSIILDNLQPSANLKRLTLVKYGGTRLSNWLGDGSLFNLRYLTIRNCLHCSSVPSLGQLPLLEELHFESMVSVRRVDSDLYGNGTSLVKPFQKLRILKFESMLEWEEWSSCGGVDNDGFPKLEELWIKYCPNLCGNLPKLLPSLRDLYIERCSELTIRIPRDASPRSLELKGCKNIAFEDMRSLNFLRSLKMEGFQSNSFPSGMTENCINLEELMISDWSSLTNLPDEGLPTTLRKLEILSCNNLLEFLPKETLHNYMYLRALKLKDSCDSMTSFPLGLFPNLECLNISKCKNLKSFSIEDEDHENLKSLLRLRVEECDQLINFSNGGLRIANLKSLYIYNCKNLKLLPEEMSTQLTSLERLSVHYCEEVEFSGGLPSNLRKLNIVSCKKLMAKMREWDLHTLSSLHYLYIMNCSEIETIDGSRLPPNLRTLDIRTCPKVKFNSTLRNTQDLPASLSDLTIDKCPLMAKQLQTMNTDLFPHLRLSLY